MATLTKKTPAARARARLDPAIQLPPRPPEGDRRAALRDLRIVIRGRTYVIGGAIEGDPETAATWDSAATIKFNIRDRDGILQDALGDEAERLDDAARMTINGVAYVLQSDSVDESGTLVSIAVEDEVAWRLRQFSRFLSMPRSKYTRAQAALRLVREASAPPYAQMRAFIPELRDRQPIAPGDAAKPDRGRATTTRGTGAGGGYRVKGERADGEQRANIDAVLRRSDRRGASERLMVAEIMAATQESSLRRSATNGIHVGLFQQDTAYGSEAKRRDPGSATDGFLDEWKRVHGSVKHAPGDLAGAIEAVQRSGRGHLYAQWEEEARRTVERWRGDGGESSSRTVTEPFEFTRGEKGGQREDSWVALARWAEELNFRRWAQSNTLFYVSDEELRAAAPALEIHGDEDWLLSPPTWARSPNRPTTDVTLRVDAQRWGVQIGALVVIAKGSARGRYIVAEMGGFLVSPELTVTLRRPTSKKPEPANETREVEEDDGSGDGGGLLDVCQHISKQGRDYDYGGGHGVPLTRIPVGMDLDCSSSCSLALFRAGFWPEGRTTAMVSGEMARSWGKPGKGREFTVFAHDGHVYIQFANGKRFDTSGGPPSGPHMREGRRSDEGRFTARRWPGH